MITVYKYPTPLGRGPDNFAVMMPTNAEILTVMLQHNDACIWAKVDTENGHEERSFRWAGTGHALDSAKINKYVGSVMLMGGSLVFHLFETTGR